MRQISPGTPNGLSSGGLVRYVSAASRSHRVKRESAVIVWARGSRLAQCSSQWILR